MVGRAVGALVHITSEEDEGASMTRLRMEAEDMAGTPEEVGVAAQTLTEENVVYVIPSRAAEQVAHMSPEPPVGMTERVIWPETKSMTMVKVYHIPVLNPCVITSDCNPEA